ncbi:MAG: hypothetical protein KDB53_21650 [Planctomycetes bacterium]|nr:hypothetical protein [Planctomycetota bacterium]
MKGIITVTCPDCGGELEIDVSREKIIGHKRKLDREREKGKDGAELFDEVVDKIRERKTKGDGLFDEAVKSVGESEKRLDDLFTEVKRKVAEEKDKPIDPDKDPRRLFWD